MRDLMLLADRIINTDFYGMRDADATPEEIIKDIETTPEVIINYLLDVIDDLQGQ